MIKRFKPVDPAIFRVIMTDTNTVNSREVFGARPGTIRYRASRQTSKALEIEFVEASIRDDHTFREWDWADNLQPL